MLHHVTGFSNILVPMQDVSNILMLGPVLVCPLVAFLCKSLSNKSNDLWDFDSEQEFVSRMRLNLEK